MEQATPIVKQTGLIIVEPTPSDYVAGVYTLIPEQTRMLDGNWQKYLPTPERQYKPYTYDTLSCTTFSALNQIETQVNFLIKENILSPSQVATLTQIGFMDANGVFNASDRFIAIMSGTKVKKGNDFKSVYDAIRNYGLLPEKDLPFGGDTFDEYHDVSITEEMKVKAKKVLDVLSLNYEWVFFDNDARFEGNDLIMARKGLLQAPLQIAIPIPAHHAILMYNMVEYDHFDTFDQYEPYIFIEEWTVPIHFALKGVVSPVEESRYIFTQDLHLGVTHPEVAELQKRLNQDPETRVASTGAGSVGQETVKFGELTHAAVVKYQKKYGIKPTNGYVGSITRKSLNGVTAPSPTPQKSKIDLWCEAIKSHEGWYLPGQRSDYPRGSISYRCNNPGNLKYVGQKRATSRTSNNFCIFASYDDGYAELKDLLTRAATGGSKYYSPDMSLLRFYEVYAPASDNNIPHNYAADVARRIGVTVDTPIKNLI